MKLLKEDYGESAELDTFVYQLKKRFNPFYRVTIKNGGQSENRYFAYKEAAQEYYDKMLNDMQENKVGFDGAYIEIAQVNLEIKEDELDYAWIDDADEDIK